jgi:MFS family permease
MWRFLLEPALLFLSPFAFYAATLLLRRTPPFAGYYWSRGTLSWLTLVGLAVAVAGMLLFGIFAERHGGAYVPAHIENGKLVPGRLE